MTERIVGIAAATWAFSLAAAGIISLLIMCLFALAVAGRGAEVALRFIGVL